MPTRLSDRGGVAAAYAAGGILVIAVAVLMLWLIWQGISTISWDFLTAGPAPGSLEQGVAGGIMALARTFGMLLGIAAGTTLFEVAGGRTGGAWGPTELGSLHLALRIAAGHALLAAVASALRGTPVQAPPPTSAS